MSKKFLEIETKYDASDIDRMKFKATVKAMAPKSFFYVESTDVYYSKGEDFIRYRMPPETDKTKRSELTFKKKHVSGNNVVRTEVNLRVDPNSEETIRAFCEGLGYTKNFSIYKICDIYYFNDANIVFYSVIDEEQKVRNFLEIEVNEELEIDQEQGKEIIIKYEKLLSGLGLTPQKRLRKSLWEMYRNAQ